MINISVLTDEQVLDLYYDILNMGDPTNRKAACDYDKTLLSDYRMSVLIRLDREEKKDSQRRYQYGCEGMKPRSLKNVLQVLTEIDIMDLPTYVNDPDPKIRTAVRWRLNNGIPALTSP